MTEEREERNIAEILCSLNSVSVPLELFIEDDVPEKETAKRKYKKHERKKRRHEIVPFPLSVAKGYDKVPNGDIIQSYPELLFEMLGRGDSDLFRNWMLSVCHPDIEMVLEYSGEQNPFGVNNRHFIGVQHCTDYLLASFKSAPDMTFTSFEPVKTKRNEITGEYFQTWTCLSEMNRVMKVVDTVSTIDAKLVEQKQADREKKAKRQETKTPSTPDSAALDTTPSDTTNTVNANTATNTATNNTTNADPLDSVTQKLAAFSLAPVEPEKIKTMCNVGQITYNINVDRKITRICNLFCIFHEKPTKKVDGIWCL